MAETTHTIGIARCGTPSSIDAAAVAGPADERRFLANVNTSHQPSRTALAGGAA